MKNVIDLSRSYRMSHGFSVCFFYFADCYEFSFFCRFAKRFKDLLFFCVAKVPSVSTIMVLYYTRYSSLLYSLFDMGRSNENDVTYPLPVLGVRSTPFASAWGKVYSLSQSAELGLPGICHYYSNNKSICLQKSGGSDRVA